MARLRSIQPTFSTLRPVVGALRDASGHSREAEPWRVWYKTAEWRRLRWATLVRDRFTCQAAACGRVVADTSKLVADHVTPHRGERSRFFDPTNLQTLCTWCHSGAKQAEERAAERGGGV